MAATDNVTTATDPEAQGLAVQLWRAITRGELTQVQEILLHIPTPHGTAFSFDDVSEITGGDIEGASLPLPVAKGWGSKTEVLPVLYNPVLDCGGIPDARKHRKEDCFKVCLEQQWVKGESPVRRCDRLLHRGVANRFSCIEPCLLIPFPVGPSAKRLAFSSPRIMRSELPEDYAVGLNVLVQLKAIPSRFWTVFELIPRKEALEAYALELEVPSAGEEKSDGRPRTDEGEGRKQTEPAETQEDLLRQVARRVESLEKRVVHLKEELAGAQAQNTNLKIETENLMDRVKDLSLRDSLLPSNIRRVIDEELGDDVREALRLGRARTMGVGTRTSSLDVDAITRQVESAVRARIAQVVEEKLEPIGTSLNQQVSNMHTSVALQGGQISTLNTDMNGASGRVQKCFDKVKRVEDLASVDSVEIGGEIFWGNDSVQAFLSPITEQECF